MMCRVAAISAIVLAMAVSYAYPHDELHPEDVDSDGEDHAADELRYFLRTLREAKAMRPMNAIEKRIQQMNETDNNFNYQYSR